MFQDSLKSSYSSPFKKISWLMNVLVSFCFDKIYFSPHNCRRPGWFSRYSDSLQSGRSGDQIAVEKRFSAPVQTGRGTHPASYTMGNGVSFPGVKRPARGFDHPPKSQPFWVFMACPRENFTFYLLPHNCRTSCFFKLHFNITFTYSQVHPLRYIRGTQTFNNSELITMYWL
jgi:hypothetical protein